jgi:hypothetical protein
MIEKMARWEFGAVILAVALALCGGSATGRAAVVASTYSVTLHFDRGPQSLPFRLHEPSGVILLYRVSAPRGTKLRAYAQLPRITVPLRIATGPIGPGRACTELRSRISCTVGEEWCPMPEGTWHFHVEKLAGPAGDVVVSFRIGNPPGQSPAVSG